jgi:hypothetical protein
MALTKTQEKTHSSQLLADFEKMWLSSVNMKTPTQVMQNLRQAQHSMTMSQRRTNPVMMDLDMSRSQFCANGNTFGVGEFEPDNENCTSLAVISHEVRTQQLSAIQWTDVRTLPGAMVSGIVELGWSVFKHFGMAEGVSPKLVASHENGDLLNSNLEVNTVLAFLEANAILVSPHNMTLSFEDTIEGYQPEVRLYYTASHAYLAVMEDDFMKGRYIYAFERNQKAINN